MSIVNILSLDNNGRVSKSDIDQLKITWNNINDKPLSSVTDIDDAIILKHNHINKNVLDLINIDIDGYPLWNGKSWPIDKLEEYECAENISKYTIVILNSNNKLEKANNLINNHKNRIIGISMRNYIIGEKAKILTQGPIRDVLWNFNNLYQPLYLNENGSFTVTKPTLGFILSIGISIAFDTILINFSNIITNKASENNTYLTYTDNDGFVLTNAITKKQIDSINKLVATNIDGMIDKTLLPLGVMDIKKLSIQNIIDVDVFTEIFNLETWCIENNIELMKTVLSNINVVIKNISQTTIALLRLIYFDDSVFTIPINILDELITKFSKQPKKILLLGNCEYYFDISLVYNTNKANDYKQLKKNILHFNINSTNFYQIFSLPEFIHNNIHTEHYYIQTIIEIQPTINETLFLKITNQSDTIKEFDQNSIINSMNDLDIYEVKGIGSIIYTITWID